MSNCRTIQQKHFTSLYRYKSVRKIEKKITFYVKLQDNTTETFYKLIQVYRDQVISRVHIFGGRWVDSRETLEDEAYSSWSVTSRIEEKWDKNEDLHLIDIWWWQWLVNIFNQGCLTEKKNLVIFSTHSIWTIFLVQMNIPMLPQAS